MIKPALLKSVSHGTEVVSMQCRFLTMINNRGYNSSWTIHHFNGSSSRLMSGSCMYLSNSMIPAALGLTFKLFSKYRSSNVFQINEVELLVIKVAFDKFDRPFCFSYGHWSLLAWQYWQCEVRTYTGYTLYRCPVYRYT